MLRLSDILVPLEFIYNLLAANSTLNFRIAEIATWTEGSYGWVYDASLKKERREKRMIEIRCTTGQTDIFYYGCQFIRSFAVGGTWEPYQCLMNI